MKLILRSLFAIAMLFAVASCGGGGGGSDAAVSPPDAAAPDATPPLTFESWVVDLVENRTSDTTDPAPDTEFLPLPESGDPHAFDSLFP